MILRIRESGTYDEDIIELNPQMDWSGIKYELEDKIEELVNEVDDEFSNIVQQALDEIVGEENWWNAEYEDVII